MKSKLTKFIEKNRPLILLSSFAIILFSFAVLSLQEAELTPVSTGDEGPSGGNLAINIIEPPEEVAPIEEYSPIMINKEHNFGLFETKLKSVGFYNGQFRADIWVKNTAGKQAEDFLWQAAYIRQIPNKYNITSAEFNGSDIQPEEEREGYLLFAGVPGDITGDVTIVIGNSVAFSAIFGTTTQAPHIYKITLE